LGRKFSRIFISDSHVIAVSPLDDHQIIISPAREETQVESSEGNTTIRYSTFRKLESGNSDVFVYDENSNLIANIEVVIDNFAFRKSPELEDQLADITRTNPVVIYAGKNLREQYPYRCVGPNGDCYYVGAAQAASAPLPSSGH
jgi:hypothetical protein